MLLKIQSNLYITPLYIAVTLCFTVTGQLPEIFTNFQLPYIFCKVELNIVVTLYITVTLPFPKGDLGTQV